MCIILVLSHIISFFTPVWVISAQTYSAQLFKESIHPLLNMNVNIHEPFLKMTSAIETIGHEVECHRPHRENKVDRRTKALLFFGLFMTYIDKWRIMPTLSLTSVEDVQVKRKSNWWARWPANQPVGHIGDQSATEATNQSVSQSFIL